MCMCVEETKEWERSGIEREKRRGERGTGGLHSGGGSMVGSGGYGLSDGRGR